MPSLLRRSSSSSSSSRRRRSTSNNESDIGINIRPSSSLQERDIADHFRGTGRNPSCSTASDGQADRKQQRQQYHLIAQEIESVIDSIHQPDYESSDEEYDDNDDDDRRTSRAPDRNKFHRRFSIGSSFGSAGRKKGRRRPSSSSSSFNQLRLGSSWSTGFGVATGGRRRSTLGSIDENGTTSSSNIVSSSFNQVSRPFHNGGRHHRHRHRHRRPSSIAEQAINSYNLFETPEQNTKKSKRKSSSSTTTTSSSAVIYNKVYHPQSFFTPILLFLSVTFCFLLILRILVAMLTMAVGMILLVLLLLRILQEFIFRPWNVLWRIHHRPLTTCCALGAIYGLLKCSVSSMDQSHRIWAMFIKDIFPAPSSVSSSGTGSGLLPGEDRTIPLFALWRWQSNVQETTNAEAQNETVELLSVAWSIGEGILYGLEIGALWSILFGDASDPTPVTGFVLRQFRRTLVNYHVDGLRFQSRRSSKRRKSKLRHYGGIAMTSSSIGDTQCMICLEDFDDEDMNNTSKSSKHFITSSSSLSSYSNNNNSNTITQKKEYVPLCLHGFHKQCLENWILIGGKSTCPICRVSIYPPVAEKEEPE